MNEKPGRIGKQYPVQQSAGNSAPTAQASVVGDRLGLVALILGIIAVVLAVALLLAVWGISRDVDNVRGLIESSANAAVQAARDAGFSAAKAETATARANVAEIYAKQLYTELNRLGYPVKTPAEDHEPQPPEPVRTEP